MCMGNALSSPALSRLKPVHPHVHGERECSRWLCCWSCGSSPCAWGTPGLSQRGAARYRFIPMCMGNALIRPSGEHERSVHPHVHGERVKCLGQGGCPNGSSPCAWGTRICRRPPQVHHRFIPMCMGNAQQCEPPTTHRPVHPHVHGERKAAFWSLSSINGSSPCAWGTHLVNPSSADTVRFIPMCMGNAL